jgi:hypothetical protein
MSEFPQLWNEYVKASTFDQLTPDQTKASVCEAIYQAVIEEKECYSLTSLRATLTAFNEDNNLATKVVAQGPNGQPLKNGKGKPVVGISGDVPKTATYATVETIICKVEELGGNTPENWKECRKRYTAHKEAKLQKDTPKLYTKALKYLIKLIPFPKLEGFHKLLGEYIEKRNQSEEQIEQLNEQKAA